MKKSSYRLQEAGYWVLGTGYWVLVYWVLGYRVLGTGVLGTGGRTRAGFYLYQVSQYPSSPATI